MADSLTHVRLGTLPFSAYAFNDPLRDVGSFVGVIPVGPNTNMEQLRRLTKRDAVAVYVVEGSTYIWGGPICLDPVWNPNESTLTITAQKWKGWLGDLVLPNGYDSTTSAKDQFVIQREMLAKALQGYYDPDELAYQSYGKPAIAFTSDLSGRTRTSVTYQQFSSVGDSMALLSMREGGFDWDIAVRSNAATGLPEPYLQQWALERGYGSSLMFQYHKRSNETGNGGNITAYTPSLSSDRPNRVWALGSGQPPDQQFAWDEDPFLVEGFTLLRESTRSFSQTTDVDTLFDYASRERASKEAVIGGIVADVKPSSYPLDAYDVGARCRVLVQDPWYDIDEDNVRIIDRAVNYSKTDGESHTLTFDLDDSEPPTDEEA